MSRLNISGRPHKMKIAIVGQTPPPHHGSNIMAETFLDALNLNGFPEYVFVNKEFSKYHEEVGKFRFAKIHRIVRFYLRLLKTVSSGDIDYVLYFVASGGIGLLVDAMILISISWFFKTKYILYIHGMGYSSLTDKGGVISAIVKRLLSKATFCLTLSRSMYQDIQDYCDRFFIIPNCVPRKDEEMLNKMYSSKAVTSVHSGNVKILFLSTLIESKGLSTLIESMAFMIKEARNFELTIVGPWRDAVFKEKIFRLIEALNVGEFIFFRGPLYGTEKVRELVSSDIFVFPTYPPEAFPLVILEAMAVGLPIVSTEVGSIPEIVADGVNGFVVPSRNPQALASAVIRLIKDEIMRQNFGRASRRLFEERYTFESYRKNLYKIFKLIDATGGMT